MEAEINIKSDNEIQLKKNEDVLRLGIRDAEGNDTGNYLEFDLQDIELPIRYQEIIEEDKKARTQLQSQLIIIERKQDHKGKKLLSSNEEAKIRAMQDFFKKEVEIYNMFLGENGVQKLLNGRKINWGTLEEINEIIDEFILPKLKENAINIKEKIEQKYGKKQKRDDVIE